MYHSFRETYKKLVDYTTADTLKQLQKQFLTDGFTF